MAKVYEALKRAEEERLRRAGAATEPAVPVPGGGAGDAGGWEAFDREATREPARQPGLLGRILRRRGGRRADLGAVNKRRITLLQPDSFVAEQYRSLRERIDALAAQRPIKTLAVTSALPGEGKTTAAINLATVTALSLGRRVLLVDCDLRRPRIHESLGLRPDTGLAEVLNDEVELERAITKVEGVNLEVLAVRGRPDNPSELLGSGKMRDLIEELARRYDRVFLDTPAGLGLPDAKAVSELCDGLIVVVRADATPQADVSALLDLLDRRRVLGLVLNGAEGEGERYGYRSG